MTEGKTKALDAKALKQKYLECFGVRASNTTALRETVKDLIDQGIPRMTLVVWAVQAGYTKGYVSSLLSRILCAVGMRERRAGAGRRLSPSALELLAHTRNRYGEHFLKVLRAAWRAGKAEVGATGFPNDSSGSAIGLIVAPELRKQDVTAIRQGRKAAGRNRGVFHKFTETSFKTNFDTTIKTRHRTRGKL